jgi:lysozyme family protein
MIPSATCRWDMQHIDDIAQEILKAQGRFVNDPDDPGGPKNYGVTLKTLKRLGHDLNQDGRVDIADLKQLSSTQAVQIFVLIIFSNPRLINCPTCCMPLCLICM